MTTTNKMSADERRATTVKAVIKLASEKNPSDISTTDIAKEMGVTQGALFRHFPTKDAILQAVMAWVAERLLSRIDTAISNAPTAIAALEAVFLTHTDFAANHPGAPRMIFGELQRPGETLPQKMVQTLLHHYSERLQALLQQGKNEGDINKNIENSIAAGMFIGSIQGLVMQSLLANDPERIRRDAYKTFAIYSRGIGGER